MQVIINADDFGLDADTVAATESAIREGVVTSATLMANMAGTGRALQIARATPGVSFGVHLTFAAGSTEAPLSPPERTPSLVDEDGRHFASPHRIRLRALAGRLRAEDVATEARAQLAFVADHGVRISHVDSHYHLHKYAAIRSALQPVLRAFGIVRMRSPQNVRAGLQPWRPTWWSGPRAARRLRRAHASTDWFVMLNDGRPSRWWLRYEALLAGDGTLEFGCHPGLAPGWRLDELEAARGFAAWCDARRLRRVDWRVIGPPA